MTTQPLITVMTSYYNDQAFLAEAISSVLAQTYTNFEYILVNHASTDKSREIARSFKDPRIKHVDMPFNYGGSGNILIKKGLEIAQGEYFKTICADDMLCPDGLEKLLHKAQESQADLVFGDVRFKKEGEKGSAETWFNSRFSPGWTEAMYLRDFLSGTSRFPYAGNFIKMSMLRQIPMDYVSIQLADIGLWVEILGRGGKLAFTKEVVADYRLHSGQTSCASKLQVIGVRCLLEHFLFYEHYFNMPVSLPLLKGMFPKDSFVKQLTEPDKDLFEFALVHAIYSINLYPASLLSARIRLGQILNDYPLAQRIEQKFGYTIKDLRKDIVATPVNLLYFTWGTTDNSQIFKQASLKTLFYFFLRKFFWVVLLRDWRHKRQAKKRHIV